MTRLSVFFGGRLQLLYSLYPAEISGVFSKITGFGCACPDERNISVPCFLGNQFPNSGTDAVVRVDVKDIVWEGGGGVGVFNLSKTKCLKVLLCLQNCVVQSAPFIVDTVGTSSQYPH